MKSTEQMQKELQEAHPSLELIDEYKGANEKTLIKCNICGHEWLAIPRSVVKSKYGCPKCARSFSDQARSNGGKERFLIDISKRTDVKFIGEYISSKDKVLMECVTCGHQYWTYPSNAVRYGCPQCSYKHSADSQRLNKEEFITRAKEIHKDRYDYSKVEYVNYHTPVIIICPEHGEFAQTPGKHLNGHGCLKCAGKNWTREDYILEAQKVHGKNRYDYSKIPEEFSKKEKVSIICPKHGEFKTMPMVHISLKSGCPKCSMSHGEIEVDNILTKYNIKHVCQYPVKNPYRPNSLFKIDFAFKRNNHLYFIEFNGRQHYYPVDLFGGEEQFKKQVTRDDDLRKLCERLNIHLLEIKYDCYNIELEIINFLKTAVSDQEFPELLETNIGEGCDANIEITKEIKESLES